MQPSLTARYKARQDVDGSWSVVDSVSGHRIMLVGEVMADLGEENAVGLADILNRDDNYLSSPTLQ